MKEGAETVAPTHWKVLLNVIFQVFNDVLTECLLGRGGVQSALLPRSAEVRGPHCCPPCIQVSLKGASAPAPIPWLIQL